MTKTVQFVFDFASPNAYLALPVLRAAAERQGARVELLPALLGGIFKATDNRAPMIAFAPVKGKLAYERLEMDRFIAKHGLGHFRMNPHFPVNTLLPMRGLMAARELGVEEPYVAAVLAAMWEDGEKMDDPEVVVRVLDSAGLDGPAISAQTGEDRIKQTLAAATQAVIDRGVFGIPTFFVGGEMFFGKDRIGQVEAELAR